MFKLKAVFLFLAIFLAGYSTLNAQKNNKKDQQYQEMRSLIEGGLYIFTVQSVQPAGARPIHTTSNYTLEVRDSTVIAYLPYFGRAYQASYGGDGGIEFEAPPENLKISPNEKKRMVNVQFDVKGKNDKYSLFLSVGSSGYASLSINSQNRQAISYSGIIGPIARDGEK